MKSVTRCVSIESNWIWECIDVGPLVPTHDTKNECNSNQTMFLLFKSFWNINLLFHYLYLGTVIWFNFKLCIHKLQLFNWSINKDKQNCINYLGFGTIKRYIISRFFLFKDLDFCTSNDNSSCGVKGKWYFIFI